MKKLVLIISAVTALFLSSGMAHAASDSYSNTSYGVSIMMLAEGQISREEAVSIALTVFDGKVLKVSKKDGDNGLVYVVKILNQAGRVRQIRINAHTGEPM